MLDELIKCLEELGRTWTERTGDEDGTTDSDTIGEELAILEGVGVGVLLGVLVEHTVVVDPTTRALSSFRLLNSPNSQDHVIKMSTFSDVGWNVLVKVVHSGFTCAKMTEEPSIQVVELPWAKPSQHSW